ncbi:dihydroneopterin triphosphate 2'-epimerase [Marinospirillum sp.]|uniref:dihydroneopterin triphosphate 2'-epimerase n=1 Tax=Marinospirillum sp. TaxID=2183934 RepID=UPI0028702B97|nr:dihydroneopterin triphosphate 2'-epimerase [Marinospirillum sp.]MDR9467473.1 dihydroneopterin triphosphate 2'-epimerase [Marinospirillum sp.]
MPHNDPYSLATIRIKNLRLRTFIGIKEDEIQNRQDVVVNAVIRYAANRAVQFNRIEEALNYRTITKKLISHVEEGRFALLERLTKELLEIIMEQEQVLAAEVEVDKPHALRFSDSVSVTLGAKREVSEKQTQ